MKKYVLLILIATVLITSVYADYDIEFAPESASTNVSHPYYQKVMFIDSGGCFWERGGQYFIAPYTGDITGLKVLIIGNPSSPSGTTNIATYMAETAGAPGHEPRDATITQVTDYKVVGTFPSGWYTQTFNTSFHVIQGHEYVVYWRQQQGSICDSAMFGRMATNPIDTYPQGGIIAWGINYYNNAPNDRVLNLTYSGDKPALVSCKADSWTPMGRTYNNAANLWNDCDCDTYAYIADGYENMGDVGGFMYYNPPPTYSNGNLYSVWYGRDAGGYHYSVIPKNMMPPNELTQLELSAYGRWSSTGGPTSTTWAVPDYGYTLQGTVNAGLGLVDKQPVYCSQIYWDVCDYTCLAYNGVCQPTDTKGCSSFSDGNTSGHCPTAYNGPGTEFGTQPCDYCTPRWNCINYVPDCSVPGTEFQTCTAVEDLDNCYGQTGLASDQYSGDYSEFTRTCYAGGGTPVEAPKEEIIPPVEPPPVVDVPLVPIEVITCNPGVEYVYQNEQKVITTFRDIEVPYVVRESVGETTCGIDADGDGNKCDLNEDFVSCGTDCKIQFTEVICLDPYRCMLTESWFLQIVLLLELLVSTYLIYTIFMG